MNQNRQILIESLTHDLAPVRPITSPIIIALLWWLITWIAVIGATLLYGPMRPGSLVQLATNVRFLLESLLGFGAAFLIALFAFRDSVPGYATRSLQWLGLGLAALWVVNYVVGLQHPTFAPHMAGKRAHCFLEVPLYALPVALLGIYLCRQYYMLAPARTVGMITLAAAMVPALFMQLACMYDPAHILVFHILPMLVLIVPIIAVTRFLTRIRAPEADRKEL